MIIIYILACTVMLELHFIHYTTYGVYCTMYSVDYNLHCALCYVSNLRLYFSRMHILYSCEMYSITGECFVDILYFRYNTILSFKHKLYAV